MTSMNAEDAVAVLAQYGYTPLGKYPGSKKRPWPMRCDGCGREKPRSLQRIMEGYRCVSCRGWLVDPVKIESLVRAAGYVPNEPYPHRTDRTWLCTCTGCGTQARINIPNVRRGHRCGVCTGRVPNPGQAEADMLARDLRPRVPYPGDVHTAWESDCLTCGRVVHPRLANVRSRDGSGCLYCAGRAVDPAEAEAFMRANGWAPLTPYPGHSTEPWECRCTTCCHVSPRTYKGAQRGYGCKFCNRQGFDYRGPGHVYVMANHQLGAVKIGVCGQRAQRSRLTMMRAHGWETYRTRYCHTGAEALRLERLVLDHLRALGLQPYLTNDVLPQNGATETFDGEQVSVHTLWQLLNTLTDPSNTPGDQQ